MRIDDFPELPNGLHDAKLLAVSIDFIKREVCFEVDAWIGDLGAPAGPAREARMRCAVVILGLAYFSMEQPDPNGLAKWEPQMIDTGAGMGSAATPVPILPPDASVNWIFLKVWNSFIHVAGTGTRLELRS